MVHSFQDTAQGSYWVEHISFHLQVEFSTSPPDTHDILLKSLMIRIDRTALVTCFPCWPGR